MQRKRFATLQASAALRGYVLMVTGDKAEHPFFVVYRWGLRVELDGMVELEQWLRGAGVEVTP